MENKDKLLISYCFIAALNNNEENLFNSVYLPLCKRALSSFSVTQEYGKATDLRSKMLDLYGINVPLYTTRQMIRAIEKASKHDVPITIFEKGDSFKITEYSYLENEAIYLQEARNANQLQEAFVTFAKSKEPISNSNESSYPLFIDFIESNKKEISNFFNIVNIDAKIEQEVQNNFQLQADFLNYIFKNDSGLLKIAEKIYLGSVIASFIESNFDLESKFETGEVYYLDTQFVLSLLDLQAEEETLPIQELVQLIQANGGKVKVLDKTVEEIENIFEKAIQNFTDNPLIAAIKNDSIFGACSRNKWKKTDLQEIADKFTETLLKKYSISQELVPPQIIDKAKKSKERIDLNEKRQKKSALHDIIAIFYIRFLRKDKIKSFKKAKYWFITLNPTLLQFNKSHIDTGFIPECILPESLTSILWLKNPKKFGDNALKVGLTELVANTLVQNIIPSYVLVDLDKLLKSKTSISEEGFAMLVSNLSRDSVEKIHNFLELAETGSPEAFNKSVTLRIETEKFKNAAKDSNAQSLLRNNKRLSEERDNYKNLAFLFLGFATSAILCFLLILFFKFENIFSNIVTLISALISIGTLIKSIFSFINLIREK